MNSEHREKPYKSGKRSDHQRFQNSGNHGYEGNRNQNFNRGNKSYNNTAQHSVSHNNYNRSAQSSEDYYDRTQRNYRKQHSSHETTPESRISADTSGNVAGYQSVENSSFPVTLSSSNLSDDSQQSRGDYRTNELESNSVNIKSIKILGQDENFDKLFQKIIESHPQKETFLVELERCRSVRFEKINSDRQKHSLSPDAPEFEFPKKQVERTSTTESADLKDNTESHEQSPSVGIVPVTSKSNWDTETNKYQSGTVKDNDEDGAKGGVDWFDESEKDETSDLPNENEGVENFLVDTEGNTEEDWQKRKQNKDFRKNQREVDNGKRDFKKVKEINGDLFTAPKDHSLAHCVAVDMRMGSGIAVKFKQDFKGVEELLDQKKRVGEVAVLEDNNRYIYYLVTKKVSNGKPLFDDLVKSLIEMRNHCAAYGVKKLAMPRIGCGLDRLEWRDVKPKIEEIFSDLDIAITVYNFNVDKDEAKYNTKSRSVRIQHHFFPLVDIQSETGLVFFGAVDGSVDDCGQNLDKKFNFIPDYRKKPKSVGEVLLFIKKEEYIYGLVIKKTESDSLSYASLHKCLVELRKKARKDKTEYLGFQAFCENGDDLTMEKFTSLVKFVFTPDIEIHLCYPKELEYLRTQTDEYGQVQSRDNDNKVRVQSNVREEYEGRNENRKYENRNYTQRNIQTSYEGNKESSQTNFRGGHRERSEYRNRGVQGKAGKEDTNWRK